MWYPEGIRIFSETYSEKQREDKVTLLPKFGDF